MLWLRLKLLGYGYKAMKFMLFAWTPHDPFTVWAWEGGWHDCSQAPTDHRFLWLLHRHSPPPRVWWLYDPMQHVWLMQP